MMLAYKAFFESFEVELISDESDESFLHVFSINQTTNDLFSVIREHHSITGSTQCKVICSVVKGYELIHTIDDS